MPYTTHCAIGLLIQMFCKLASGESLEIDANVFLGAEPPHQLYGQSRFALFERVKLNQQMNDDLEQLETRSWINQLGLRVSLVSGALVVSLVSGAVLCLRSAYARYKASRQQQMPVCPPSSDHSTHYGVDSGFIEPGSLFLAFFEWIGHTLLYADWTLSSSWAEWSLLCCTVTAYVAWWAGWLSDCLIWAVGGLCACMAVWLALDLAWADDESDRPISWDPDDHPPETPANENVLITVRSIKKPKKKKKASAVQDAHNKTSSLNTTVANQQQEMPQFTAGLDAAEANVPIYYQNSVFTSPHAADVGSGPSADELKVFAARAASKAVTESSTIKVKSTNELDSGVTQMSDVQNDHDVRKDVSRTSVNRGSNADPNTDTDSRGHTALSQRMSSEQMFARVVSAVKNPAGTDDVGQAAQPDGIVVPDVDEGKCVICIDQDSTHVLVECGHWCVCEKCIQEIVPGVCPICRVEVTKSIRVFKS